MNVVGRFRRGIASLRIQHKHLHSVSTLNYLGSILKGCVTIDTDPWVVPTAIHILPSCNHWDTNA